ncbi:MAG TPA: VOC family protein [Candidatus Krumholzibacteria bacterium]|nr:VOC family protein [Candidatus Krumholzibacteria bacterium]
MMTSVKLSSIGQIAVTVRDLERAKNFYRDILGMPFLFEAPGMVFFRAGDTRLMLGLPENDRQQFASVLYFRVDDIQSAYLELKEKAVPFTHEPRLIHRGPTSDLWLAFFTDPDGNTMALMGEVARRD